MALRQTKEVNQTDLKLLLEKVVRRYLESCPGERLIVNSNPANYEPLADSINMHNGELLLIKSEWLRTLFYTKQKESISKIKREYYEVLLKYIGEENIDNENESTLDGNYVFIYRGTKQRTSISTILYEHSLVIKNGSVHLEVEGALYISRRIIDLQTSVTYIELLSKTADEMVYLAFHKGIAAGEDLNFISGIFLSVDNSPLPTSGPFLMVKNKTDINKKVISSYFRKFPVTSLKSMNINEVNKLLDKDTFASTTMSDYEIRREGLIGKWTVLNISKDRINIEIAHLFIEMYSIRFESVNNYYTEGDIKIVGDRSLVISMYNSGRHATVIANLNHYRKTHHIKYFASSYSATGSIRPIYGFSLLVRTSILESDLEVGDYSKEEVINSGVKKEYLEYISNDSAGVIPEIKLI